MTSDTPFFDEYAAKLKREAELNAMVDRELARETRAKHLKAQDEQLRGIAPKPALPVTSYEAGARVTDARVAIIYDPVTGDMTPTPRLRLGVFEVVMPSGKVWRADHLAYLVMGHRPPRTPQHRDGNPANLEWSNIHSTSKRSNTGQKSIYERKRADIEVVKNGKTEWVAQEPVFDVILMPRMWKSTIYAGTRATIPDAMDLRDEAVRRWDAYLARSGLPTDKRIAAALIKGKGELD